MSIARVAATPVSARVNAATASNAARESRPVSFTISRRACCAIWITVFTLQVLTGSLLAIFAWMYASNDTTSFLWFIAFAYLFSEQQAFLYDYHTWVAVGYGILSFAFFLMSCEMVTKSLVSRELKFSSVMQPSLLFVRSKKITSGTSTSARMTRFQSHAFSIRGRYFVIWHTCKEIFEVVLQIIQAEQTSRRISNRYLNLLYGFVVFTNCATPLLLHDTFKENLGMYRLLSVIVDSVLDFCWGAVIQAWLLQPYVAIYRNPDAEWSVFDSPECQLRELSHIMILSSQAFVLSVIPFISMWFAVSSISKLMETAHTASDPETKHSMKIIDVDFPRSTERTKLRCGGRLFRLGMMLTGTIILIISLHASRIFHASVQTVLICGYPLFAWLASNEICAQRVFDCANLNISGRISELDQLFGLIDGSSYLSSIVFDGCNQLEMPSGMNRFQGITTLVVNNSTIVRWPLDAAIVDANYPALTTLFIYGVTFSCTPFGIFEEALPRHLEWVDFSGTNMSQVISKVNGFQWQGIRYFYCDECGLVVLPSVIATMVEAREITLSFNGIADIGPGQLRLGPNVYFLRLDDNPLNTLPDDIWATTSWVSWFALRRTFIDVIPQWVLESDNTNLEINMEGTPLCRNDTQLIRVVTSQTINVNCGPIFTK